ncbi:MAG: hypothetical protein CMJ19_23485 [Phycisphaeraceae bacterium]|nr:hypothetical protein [Phycisphaeraceae bacterium]
MFIGYADFDRVLGRKTVHSNFDHRQVGIATETAALNTEMGNVVGLLRGWARERLVGKMVSMPPNSSERHTA